MTITPAAGQVVVNSVDPALTLSTRSDAVHLDSDGLMRAYLVCTDDPDIEPHNSWTYSFRGDWSGSPTVTCPVPMVPVDPETGKMPPLNLSTAVSRASVSGVLITKGAPGDRGPGIASIDPDGTVHLDDGSTVTWDLPPAVADDAAVAELVASVSETAAAVDARVSSAVVDKLDEPAVDARVRAVGDGTYVRPTDAAVTGKLGSDRSWVNLWNMLPAGVSPASVTDWLPYFNAAHASLNPNGADPCGGTVFIPAMSTPYLVSDTVKVGNKTILRGAGRSTSMIKPTVGFVVSHPLVQLGNGSTLTQAFGTRIEDLYVNCDNRVEVAVYSNQVNEQGGVRNCSINKFTDIGVDFDATGATLQVPMGVVECEISPSNSSSWRYGIRYTAFPDGPIRKVTINSGASVGIASVYLDSCPNFTVQALHAERCADAIYVTGSTCYGHIDGLTATTGVTGTGVRLAASQQGRVYMNNLYAPNATNVVNDEASSTVITSAAVGGIVSLFVVEKNASGSQATAPVFTTAPGVMNRWRSDMILHGARIIYQRALQAAVSGSVAVNLVNGNFVELQFGGNITNLSIGQPVDGMRFTLRLKQDAVGSRTVSWASTWHFENGATPTLSTAPNTSDFFEFICLGGHAYQVSKQITGVTA